MAVYFAYDDTSGEEVFRFHPVECEPVEVFAYVRGDGALAVEGCVVSKEQAEALVESLRGVDGVEELTSVMLAVAGSYLLRGLEVRRLPWGLYAHLRASPQG